MNAEKALQFVKDNLKAENPGIVLFGYCTVEEDEQEDKGNLLLPTLKNGSTGGSVKAMQILLIGNNCSCGNSGADGNFGPATENAVTMYQKKTGLPATGVCDVSMWKKLLGA